jgi:hypothetical protein
VRASGPPEDESFATLEAAATKVGVGSGPKQVQVAVLDDSKSPSQPSSLSPSPLSPTPSPLIATPNSGSQPHSMLTPSSGFVAADISTSFPRSRSHEYTTSRKQLVPPPPKLTSSSWEIRRLMIVITIVLLAIATYLLVRPR